MDDRDILRDFFIAFTARNFAAIASIIEQHRAILEARGKIRGVLGDAAKNNDVEMMEFLVKHGADIHASNGSGDPPPPEGVICDATGNGAIDAVRWLLDRGAQMNFTIPEYPGESRCMPLITPICEGDLELVKLLVERGANINAYWINLTPLAYAIMYDQHEVADYLRSKGALEPNEIQVRAAEAEAAAAAEDPSIDYLAYAAVLAHVQEHLGPVKELSLKEVVPGDPPISVYVVPPLGKRNWRALVTCGMSVRPMRVPPGAEEFKYAECVIYLPPEWPLTAKALKNPKHFWPIEWLRKIAYYPHENKTWLGGPSAIFANGEPPQPFAANTNLSCMLAVTEPSAFGWLTRGDKRTAFYTLIPLYTEERDLEKAHGMQRLIQLFDQQKMPVHLVLDRPNVALLES